MASTTTKSLFLKGLVDSLPFLLVASPFGLLFGVLSAEAGLNVLEALAFSLAVFAALPSSPPCNCCKRTPRC